MHRTKLTCAILVLAAASSMWACGSDDDSTVAPAGGAAGKGGSGGSAGKATAGSGGTAGKAGGTSTAGKAGAVISEGGEGGEAPIGSGGAAEAGTGAGGSGGEAGGEPTGEGGEAGGASVPTHAENCATVCTTENNGSTCPMADCVNNCTGAVAGGTQYPEEYEAMIACEAQKLVTADYECSDNGPPIGTVPAPKNGTACQTEICKWTCDDATIVDVNVYTWCGCT